MSQPVLEQLKSDDFAVSVGFHSNPSALRRRLARMQEVAAVRNALRQGAIAEQTIGQFVARLIEDFTAGEHFAHGDVLAALCVALERRPTAFAQKFLDDLSDLQLAEMSLCIRVARECRKHRVNLARCESRIFALGPNEESAFSATTFQSPLPENGNRQENVFVTYEVA